jgi:hypothetical protein
MTTRHTPEPWHVEYYRHGTSILGEDYSNGSGLGSRAVAAVVHDNRANDSAAANAARVVACVNACAGIEDPAKAFSLARVALLYAVSRFSGEGMEVSANVCAAALAELKWKG